MKSKVRVSMSVVEMSCCVLNIGCRSATYTRLVLIPHANVCVEYLLANLDVVAQRHQLFLGFFLPSHMFFLRLFRPRKFRPFNDARWIFTRLLERGKTGGELGFADFASGHIGLM
jgi:hypothetical protein